MKVRNPLFQPSLGCLLIGSILRMARLKYTEAAPPNNTKTNIAAIPRTTELDDGGSSLSCGKIYW